MVPNCEEFNKLIKERMEGLEESDICALFLLAVTKRDRSGQEEKINLKQAEERIPAFLCRLFRQSDLVCYLGENNYLIFMSGRFSPGIIWEKASVLTKALWLASEELIQGQLSSYVGVYLFDGGEEPAGLLKKAGYALEMARKNENRHFYIHTSAKLEADGFFMSDLAVPTRTLTNYLDEGVRLLEVGPKLRTLYISPGFYRRLFLLGEAAVPQKVKIHPLDQESHERNIRKAVEEGGEVESQYRVSGDGQGWIPCRVQLQCVAAGAHPVVLEISHNIAGLVQLKNRYELNRAWLRFLAKQSGNLMWEVDIRTKTFRFLYNQKPAFCRPAAYGNFPESMIESGRIHRDSAERFRSFARDLLAGKMNGHDKFIVQYDRTGCYGWVSMFYHMLYDKDGHPEKAIGMKEDLSYLPVGQMKGGGRRNVPVDLFPNLFCFIQANLTEDRVECLRVDGREISGRLEDSSYTYFLGDNLKRLFSAGDMKRFRKQFNRSYLLEAHAGGRQWFYEMYKMVNEEGTIRDAVAAVNVNRDSHSGDVYMFGYFGSRDSRAKWEKKLNFAPRLDCVTGVYLPDTAKTLCRKLLKENPGFSCAVAEICIEGAAELFGDQRPDPAEQDIMTALNVFLDTDCIVFQNFLHSLVVFIPAAPSRNKLKRKLDDVFLSVRISLEENSQLRLLRFIAGVVYRNPEEMAEFDQMVDLAHRLCSIHGGEAEDMVFFGQDEGKMVWSSCRIDEPKENLREQELKPEDAMSDEEQKAALSSLGQMLQADTRDLSVNHVLKTIGEYYHADRVYILLLTQKCQIVTMMNEWAAKGKVSIQQVVSGKPTNQFPVLAHYLKNPNPICLALKSAKEGENQNHSWQFSIFPMESLEEERQLLCVENPRQHSSRSALVGFLLPYLAGERKRFMARREGPSALDRLFGLSNRKTYEDTIYSINSDAYISLGALAVDIPDFALIKEQRGYEYGSSFLVKISEVMGDVFGSSLLFRTGEAEFIALCLNMTYEAFFNRCSRTQQLIGRKYAGLFRVGQTWSDQVFKGEDLVNKARSIMKCSGFSDALFTDREKRENGKEDERQMRPGMGKGRFTIYLQPQIDMRTGKLVGAEALARVQDDKGELLPHVGIIKAMEQEGTIQDMDYFVFDKALQTMSQWKEKGYELPHISSNFSRITLLNPASLASILAISSRYPDVPQSRVEMEITETAGDFENNTFADLIRRFGRYGFRFSLDDFGSSYSNLSMLTNLHFHSIKLDRSMICNISENSVTRMLVRDIVKICTNCGMTCIAEGVENREQADMLLEDGCFYAQGYYYDRPMPLGEFEQKYLQP